MSAQRRMLVISFSYAPMLNARAFRWTALAAHFAAHGWQVDVLTSRQPDLPAEESAGRLRVHRVGSAWAESLRGVLRRQRGQVADSAGGKRSGAGRLLHLAREGLWRHVCWPDSSCLWYGAARRKALDLVRAEPPQAIVSVSPTFTAVLVGRAASDAAPGSKWLLDYGDPFSLQQEAAPNNRALYGGLNRRVERRVLARADAVSVTTPQTAERYGAAFPESAPKIHVIPPLLTMAASTSAPGAPPDGAVRFVYVGTLYRGLREPQFLAGLVEALAVRRTVPRIELHLYGDAHQFSDALEAWQRRLGGRLHVHGMVPRDTVARAIENATVLVNIGNASADQLPSKVVEYAASGKPILNIVRAADDSSAQFLESYPDRLVLVDPNTPPSPAQVEALDDFTRTLPRRVAAERVEAWLAPYRLPQIAAEYEKLLG